MPLPYRAPIGQSKRETRPNGMVLFRDVPIARTGEQLYHPSELGLEIEPGPDGMIRGIREAADLFAPQTVDAWEGVSFIDEHPEGNEDITPDNFREAMHGVILNPHQGTGDLSNALVADVLVMSRDAIAAIDAGKRELSCGYANEWHVAEPGIAYQRAIIPNHVALVDAGRCGGMCAIRDKQPQGEGIMPKLTRTIDRIRKAFHTKDEAGFTSALSDLSDETEEMTMEQRLAALEASAGVASGQQTAANPAADLDEGDTRMARIEAALQQLTEGLTGVQDRFRTMDEQTQAEKAAQEQKAREGMDGADEIEEEMPDDLKEKAKGTRDSSYLLRSFDDVRSKAEVIAPGVTIPRFDSQASAVTTVRDCLCKLRRDALEQGARDQATADLMKQLQGSEVKPESFRTMDRKAVRSLFDQVAVVKQTQNRSAFTASVGRVADTADANLSPADLYVQHARKYWATQKKEQ